MVEVLKGLLAALGLSPLGGSIILLLALAISFFLKEYFSLKNKLKEINATYKVTYRGKIDDKLLQYSALQVKALLEAYRMLYENSPRQRISSSQFAKAIEKADALVMQPFTEHASFLDNSIKGHIYDIHNILEQFKYNPSETAIKRFFDYRGDFFRLIQKAISAISIQKWGH